MATVLPNRPGSGACRERAPVRLGLEVSRAFQAGDGVFTPELGGRLAYTDPGMGLSVDTSVRALVAHEDPEYGKWGASCALRLDSGASGRGSRSAWRRPSARREPAIDNGAGEPIDHGVMLRAGIRWQAPRSAPVRAHRRAAFRGNGSPSGPSLGIRSKARPTGNSACARSRVLILWRIVAQRRLPSDPLAPNAIASQRWTAHQLRIHSWRDGKGYFVLPDRASPHAFQPDPGHECDQGLG